MSCNPYLSPSISFNDLSQTPIAIQSALDTFSSTLNYSPSGAYKQQDLIDGGVFLTNITRVISSNSTFVKRYPILIERVKKGGNITEAEYEDFLRFSAVNTDVSIYEGEYFNFISNDDYTITDLPIIITDYLDKAETFYQDNFAGATTGNFCSTLTEVLDNFFMLQSISTNLNSKFESISQLLQQLVDNIVDKIKGIVSDTINQAIGFVNKIQANIQRIQQFFDEENINAIKEQIKQFMAGISNKFENLTPDVIAYMLYKFCQLASAIESLMMAPANLLNNTLMRFRGAESLLASYSNQSRFNVTNAGGFLIDPDTIKRIKNETGNDVNGNAGATTDNNNNATPSNWVTAPFTDAERKMAGEIATLTKENIDNFSASKHLDLSLLINSGKQNVVYAPHEKIEYAWQRVHPEVWIRLIRISTRLSKRLIINSAYRSPERQLYMFNNGQTTAASGYHNKNPGLAVDVSYSSFALSGGRHASFETMIKMGSQEGFNGIGIYSSFIHLDAREYKATWGSGHAEALRMHVNNEFREGGTISNGYDSIPQVIESQESTPTSGSSSGPI